MPRKNRFGGGVKLTTLPGTEGLIASLMLGYLYIFIYFILYISLLAHDIGASFEVSRTVKKILLYEKDKDYHTFPYTYVTLDNT